MPGSGTSTFSEPAAFGTALREHCTSALTLIEPARFKARLTRSPCPASPSPLVTNRSRGSHLSKSRPTGSPPCSRPSPHTPDTRRHRADPQRDRRPRPWRVRPHGQQRPLPLGKPSAAGQRVRPLQARHVGHHAFARAAGATCFRSPSTRQWQPRQIHAIAARAARPGRPASTNLTPTMALSSRSSNLSSLPVRRYRPRHRLARLRTPTHRPPLRGAVMFDTGCRLNSRPRSISSGARPSPGCEWRRQSLTDHRTTRAGEGSRSCAGDGCRHGLRKRGLKYEGDANAYEQTARRARPRQRARPLRPAGRPTHAGFHRRSRRRAQARCGLPQPGTSHG